MKLTILGGGKWGTTLTTIYSNKFENENIVFWIRPESKSGIKPRVENVRESRINPFDNFPNVILPANVELSSDIQSAVEGADIVINTIPSKHLEEYLNKIKGANFTYFVNASKGVIKDKPIYYAFREIFGNRSYAVLSGPNIAKDIITNYSKNQELISPASATLACEDSQSRVYLSQILDSKPFYRVFPHKDVLSVEYCGILKQVYAMAIGYSIGLEYSVNTVASLFHDCSFEIQRILKKLELNPEVFLKTKAGMPDLEVTYKSGRNGRFGYIAAKSGVDGAIEKMEHECIEGLRILESLHRFKIASEISLPILEACYRIVHEKASPEEQIEHLINYEIM